MPIEILLKEIILELKHLQLNQLINSNATLIGSFDQNNSLKLIDLIDPTNPFQIVKKGDLRALSKILSSDVNFLLLWRPKYFIIFP